jgi:aminoglycoside phosphotransferase
MDIYNINEINAFLLDKFNLSYKITSIGNHHLKRNAVYLLEYKNIKFVFKMYKKDLRAFREKNCLNLLANKNLPIPELIDSGYDMNHHWLLESYLEGENLNSLIEDIPALQLSSLFFDLGELLHSLHDSITLNSFDPIDFLNSSNKITFKQIFDTRINSIENTIKSQILPDKKILNLALSYLKNNYNLIQDVKTPTLCHNDFDPRNILVKRKDDSIKCTGLIDFEQSIPWDRDLDFISIYHKILSCNPLLHDAFFKGYNLDKKNKNAFETKKAFYLIYQGVMICSFAYNTAPHYYNTGLTLIENNLPKHHFY